MKPPRYVSYWVCYLLIGAVLILMVVGRCAAVRECWERAGEFQRGVCHVPGGVP